MTEEIIIDGGRMAGITTLKNEITRLEQERDELKRDNKRMKAILEGCGLEENGDCTYCNVDKAYHELKQENKELKSRMMGKTGFICDCTKAENYRSALEEINLILDELKQQYDYMANYSEIEEIQNKINEVLHA